MTVANNLEVIEVNPNVAAQASVIWLHGLGADGSDFVSIVPELNLPAVRFVFPHAPVRPITINNGYAMRGWFDIMALDINAPQDEAGLNAMHSIIENLINKETERGVPAAKIVLAGFSQGGAMALHSGLRYQQALAGILGLSTFLPLHDKLPQQRNAANNNTPIMLAHGTQDAVVPLLLGELTRNYLQQLNYSVNWHTYSMQHQVVLQEIKDIANWLKNILS